MNLSVCWAILKYIIDEVYRTEDPTGDFIFMRSDPSKTTMKLFKKTVEEYEEEEEEDGEL